MTHYSKLMITIAATMIVSSCGDNSTTEPRSIDGEYVPEVLTEASMMSTPAGRVTMPCPNGGERTADVSVEASIANDRRTARYSATLLHDQCGMQFNGNTITVHGSSTSTGTVVHSFPVEPGQRPTLFEMTTTTVSDITTTVDGKSRNCQSSVTNTYQPATQTVRMTGTMCGHDIDVTRPAFPPTASRLSVRSR